MLLTTCPKCEAQFKVTPEQLNVRQGRVMCGRCRDVFNAFQSLERVDSAFLTPAPAPNMPVESAIQDPAEIRGVNPPSTIDGPLPIKVIESMANVPMPVLEFAPTSPEEVAPAPTANVSEPRLDPLVSAPYRQSEDSSDDAFEFDSSADRPHWMWRIGIGLLALCLAAQAAYFFRSTIVSNYPEMRPYFSTACEWLACALPWNRDDNALKVESSDLIEEIGAPGRFLLTATISNRAKTVQDYPNIELTLTDTNNQTLTRRVLQPKDYLGNPLQRDQGMAPGTETMLNLRLEATSSRAAGYHLLLFYP